MKSTSSRTDSLLKKKKKKEKDEEEEEDKIQGVGEKRGNGRRRRRRRRVTAMASILAQYTQLTGRSAMLPKVLHFIIYL